MIFAIVESATGRLVSTTDSEDRVASPELLAADGTECVAFPDLGPWEAGGPWDPATRTFLPRDPPDEVLAQHAQDPGR